MNIEIINTGSELILGRTLNSHQQWLCNQLALLGFPVTRQVTVSDDASAIQNAVRDALSRADLVITTGGLGPTSDDVTRELIADLLGKKLVFHPETLARIERFFAQRNRHIPENARKQTMVPEGATVLPNDFGTAPGLAMCVAPNPFHVDEKASWLVMLPGPPRELHPMFNAQVVPLLHREFPNAAQFVCRSCRTTGLGESFVEEKIAASLENLIRDGLELGYCARIGEVEVRFAARGEKSAQLVEQAERIANERLADYIFTRSDEPLEKIVLQQLTERKQTLALAESCTGGLIAHRITNVPGASAIFIAGLVTYSNEAKQKLLGVRAETLEKFGAVSEPTAREMAEGAREKMKTDFAVAVTGIAGPSGGTPEKPVGTVYIAISTPHRTIVEKNLNPYDRESFKLATAQQALDLLRRNLD